jgi:hypothetical protein
MCPIPKRGVDSELIKLVSRQVGLSNDPTQLAIVVSLVPVTKSCDTSGCLSSWRLGGGVRKRIAKILARHISEL